FNTAKPWGDAVISNRPFAGNTGSVDDSDEIQRNLNDTNYNRMHAVVVSVIQIALYFVAIVNAAGVTRKRTIRDHRIAPRFSRVK
ncbi:hypothetical protein F7F89_28410, partial [Escherichia coli]